MIPLYHYRAKVKRIIDGDTIVLDIDLGFHTIIADEPVRLTGINAPETRTKDLEEKNLGKLSKERLEELCPVDSYVFIRTEKAKEKFGRYLGTIYNTESYSSDKSVNQILLDENFAEVYDGHST
jgi:micrococcal nuclease